MKRELYNAIYRLFEEGSTSLVIKVGSVTLKFWTPEKEYYTVWEMGICANGEVYTIDSLYQERLGPGNFAQLFAGEFDIINGLTEVIYAEEF